MTYSFSSLPFLFSWGHCQSPQLISRISLWWRPVFSVSLCSIEMSGVFSLSSRMLKLGCEAGSHVCFGRITCLLLWDGLLINHTLPQYTLLMQLLSMSLCVKETYKCQGTQLTMLHVSVTVYILACECLAYDGFMEKNWRGVSLRIVSGSDGTPTDHPINLKTRAFIDRLMHITHKSSGVKYLRKCN